MAEMAQHDFSPITGEERLRAAIDYIAEKSLALSREVLGRELTIDTICIFTHSPEEYDFVKEAVRARGDKSRFSHGPTTYVDSDFTVLGQHIRIFGVRSPDPSRPQVGYGDYPVTDCEEIRAIKSPYLKEIISGRGQSLIELRHPEFDVLGFVADAKEHA